MAACRPTRCASTPTQAYPCWIRCSWVWNQSTSWSQLLVTFVHSASTTPLNFAAEVGRRTTIRVLYGCPELSTVAVLVPVIV